MDIETTRATYAEVEPLIKKIVDSVDGEPMLLVNMACLAISMVIQHPGIKGPELAEGIKGASEWMALYAESLVNPTTGPVN